jgi:hypothetical protein
MSELLAFKNKLFGFLVALFFLVPYIAYLQKPTGCADTIPESVYQASLPKFFVMHNIKNTWLWHLGIPNTDLKIELASYKEVNKEFKLRYPNDKDEVFGFYYAPENKIFCVDDAETLIHELRHVFEMDWHK